MPSFENRKQDVGLVLSGGGGKGAYEIGVWKALDEYGVTPNIGAISGTSVGALNSALFAQRDLELALNVWSTISPEAVMTLNNLQATQKLSSAISDLLTGTRFYGLAQSLYQWITKRFADQGVLSKKGLSSLIDESIDPNCLCKFPGPIFVAAFKISSQSVRYFDLKENGTLEGIKERLLASASIPVIFGKTYIDGELYWDGGIPGIGDNTPVRPLYDIGYRNLIVIHLTREMPVDRKVFPNCSIIEIMPQQDLGGLISGTMNFRCESALENINRGYNDAIRVLEPLFKTGRALNRIQSAFERINQEQITFAEQNQLLEAKIANTGKDIDSLLGNLNNGGKL